MELTLKQKTAFGIGAVGKDMVYALSASYVMYYYQDVLGLSASFVGVVLMAARFFDAFNDPFMQTFVVKAASGVAVFLTGIGLDLIGLVGNTEETGPVAVQSAGTLLGLRLMMTVLPMLVLAGALVLFRRKFVLTDARAAEISAQLHGEETHHD